MIVITLLKIFLALTVWVICVMFGWLFTETKLRLAKIEMFDFAPFNCRKCFTFWLTVCVSIITVFVLNLTLTGIILFVLGILTAIAMTVEDNKLIEK